MKNSIEKIKLFSRNVLGCQCPEEVFAKIEISDEKLALKGLQTFRRIIVGDRLLIYVLELHDQSACRDALLALLQEGVLEKKERRLNRLRIVIASEELDSIRSIAEKTFDGFEGKDEKVHLHVVSPNEILDVL